MIVFSDRVVLAFRVAYLAVHGRADTKQANVLRIVAMSGNN